MSDEVAEPDHLPVRSNVSSQGCQTNRKFLRGFSKNKSVSAHIKPRMKSASTQTTLESEITPAVMVTCGTQSEDQTPPDEDLDISGSSSSDIPAEDGGSSYAPSSSNSSDHRDVDLEFEDVTPPDFLNDPSADLPMNKQEKYIVFLPNLLNLLRWCHCPACGETVLHFTKDVVGTLLTITFHCTSCSSKPEWRSQPRIGRFEAGNILLSAAILFAGASATKVLRVFQHMNIITYATRTFLRHQKYILVPSVDAVWQYEQDSILAVLQLEGRPLTLAGDGRADSPGHSAKFGTYSVMDVHSNLVIDIKLVQSNECGGSAQMENEGLIRIINFLDELDLTVGVLITDRHRQIAKWMRINMPETEHLYDTWHVAKGLTRTLESIGRERGCFDVKVWIQSIINHLYWSAASTEQGNGELILSKWKSVLNHIQNIHEGHDDRFPQCLHGQLLGDGMRKQWIKQCSRSAVRLEKVILSDYLLRDIPKLAGRYQTSSVEALHCVYNHFAPKLLVFGYNAMLARYVYLQHIAALHFNENTARPQATTKGGVLCHKVKFPKAKKGGYTVTKVLEKATYDYVDRLMSATLRTAQTKLAERAIEMGPGHETPPPLCSQYDRPIKEAAIQEKRSRYQ